MSDDPDDDTARSAAAALLAARVPPESVVLVLASSDHLADLVRRVHPGVVVVADDARDPALREQMATLTPTGRPDVVVTEHAARAATRAVVRGGIVCLPWESVEAPTVTEVVQRELRLIGTPTTDLLDAHLATTDA